MWKCANKIFKDTRKLLLNLAIPDETLFVYNVLQHKILRAFVFAMSLNVLRINLSVLSAFLFTLLILHIE